MMNLLQTKNGTVRGLIGGIAVVCLVLCAVPETQAATISGTVRAQGPQIGEADAAGRTPYQSRRYRFADRVDYSEIRDFVVYIEEPGPGTPLPDASERRATVIQRDAMFQPAVLPILIGTSVDWPNRDDIYHNVFSISEAKEFDLGFYKDEGGAEPNHVVFDKPGRVDVFCAIHTRMHCVILVLENPYFTVADPRGRYVLEDVPPGTYRIRAWHPRLPSQAREVTVPEEGVVEVDFNLGFGEASGGSSPAP